MTVALVILGSVLKLTLNCQKTVSPDNIRCQFSLYLQVSSADYVCKQFGSRSGLTFSARLTKNDCSFGNSGFCSKANIKLPEDCFTRQHKMTVISLLQVSSADYVCKQFGSRSGLTFSARLTKNDCSFGNSGFCSKANIKLPEDCFTRQHKMPVFSLPASVVC